MNIKRYDTWYTREEGLGQCEMREKPLGPYIKYEDFHKLFIAARNLMHAPRKGAENADAVFALWNVLEDIDPKPEKESVDG